MPKRQKTKSKREKKRAIQAVEAILDVKIIDSVQMKPSGPVHLVESIRTELIALVKMPDLAAHLGTIARMARQADDLLVVVKSPEAVMRGEHAILGATSLTLPTANPETYGSSILRQLIPALQDFRKSQNETPEAMVQAITLARRNGMTDVAAELEKKLTGKSLDGERPVKKDAFGLDSYLPPALGPAPNESGPQAVILGHDPAKCDAIYPRTRDGRCQGCGIVGDHPKKPAAKKNGKSSVTSVS